jgi:hypothetical protein
MSTEHTEDEWVKDVSRMITAWFVATAAAAGLLLYVGFWM